MKVACLLGSPRPAGNSAAIARRFADTAAGLGAEVGTFALNGLASRGCQGCYACKTGLDRCVLEDGLTAVLDAVREADIVVLATPVYYGEVTAQLKGFIDRTFSYLVPDYLTNPHPSRLAPGKRLVFVITQGNPDEGMFADIFPRYAGFMKWQGFTDIRLLRACGVGPHTDAPTLEPHLQRAEELARALMA